VEEFSDDEKRMAELVHREPHEQSIGNEGDDENDESDMLSIHSRHTNRENEEERKPSLHGSIKTSSSEDKTMGECFR
jgi:hypothetical protein